MRYWPLHLIATSPMLAAPYQVELQEFYHKMPSEGAYYAAFDVARRTEAVHAPNLVVVETVGASARRVYTQYPELDEWLRLERTIIMERYGQMFFMVEALH